MTIYLKPPQDDSKYSWTKHSIEKMRQYGLSSQRIKRIIKNPKRVGKGIAKNTIAVMQPLGKGKGKNKWSSEIWVMYQKTQKYNIISAWRYPGVSPIKEVVPIPDDILQELKNYFKIDKDNFTKGKGGD